MEQSHEPGTDELGNTSRRGALGALALAAATASMFPTRRAEAANPTFADVKADYGAVGDGVADDTAKLQQAANSGKSLYFPPGIYKITDTIQLPVMNSPSQPANIVYRGAGKGVTIIRQVTAGKDAFVHISAYFRMAWRDIRIEGNSGTGHAIRTTGSMYTSEFTEMDFYMGGSGVHAINAPVFSTLFTRCDFSSHDSHGIEIVGGNTCTFVQCYAIDMAPGKYGYRVYERALFLGCNGIHLGGGWGLFGQSTAEGDPKFTDGRVTLINCNIEDHTQYGVRIMGTATANFINCTFVGPVQGSSFESHLHIDFTDRFVELVNCTFAGKGGSRVRLRSITCGGSSGFIKAVGCRDGAANLIEYEGPNQQIVKLATEGVAYNEFLTLATVLNSLKVGTLTITGDSSNIQNALVLSKNTNINAEEGTITPPGKVKGYLVAHLNTEQIRIPYYSAEPQ